MSETDAMTADAFCLLCRKPIAYYDLGGWAHVRDGLRVWARHDPVPDRGAK